MIIYLFRLLILVAAILLIYTAYKYVINPKRKLELAQEKKQFYFLDDAENVKKNFLLTYKGVLFEGEKYLGTTENSFDVVSISVWTRQPDKLKGFERNDLYFVEKEIYIHYPHARVEWKNPINKLVLSHSGD
ncbi:MULTISPECIES: sigma-w pathway protein ysdB [Pontibacillus]|uniref:Sigma-w pathway protein ysdB n=1 Tax=Pontibacillus chungwhensis TaxID=265426 RepID=A0ABY8UXE6_9BACI|nr:MULTISPECIES: sigma-w pathway protein ysdB [Pontibacillus]MCD5323806.1 sigma-w pathway protein ysdB [Pontibacillus sp. HN14]WIF97169.1 sigma-w pathway protein ysdB [Pontibacillus chungwhensis]